MVHRKGAESLYREEAFQVRVKGQKRFVLPQVHGRKAEGASHAKPVGRRDRLRTAENLLS